MAVEPRAPLRVVVTGSESTGKSTLAEALAGHLQVPWVAEFSRDYAASLTRELGPQDVEPIARGQMSREDEALRSAHPVVILDTDLVSTLVYARHYYGDAPDWLEDAVRHRLADQYLLLDVDLPWIADGIRDRPHARHHLHQLFHSQLSSLGANVVPISGFGAARLEAALRVVDSHLKRNRGP